MKRLFASRKLSYLIFGIAFSLVVMGIYPGSGGEGAQRELTGLNTKRDWWNFATAALYGFWPDKFFPWTFTLALVQLIIYSLGIFLISKNLRSGKNKGIFWLIALIGGFFVFQLWRDATLFAIQCLSVGLIAGVRNLSERKVWFIISLASFLNVVGSLFKPIFAPISAIILFLILLNKTNDRKIKRLLAVGAILIAVIPYFADKEFSQKFHLVKSYPEQQVMIYDLSKLYCWGYSPDLISQSKKALAPLLTNPDNFEPVCASLSPTGWDSLHVRIPEVKGSPALVPLSQDQSLEFQELKDNWGKAIFSSPTDWFMTKASDATQVTLMANSFYMPDLFSKSASNLVLNAGDWLLKVLLFPIVALDKIRFFSLGFTLFIGLVLIYLNRARGEFSKQKEKIYFGFLATNLLTLSFAALAFIANNGRYVLPYMLLSYFYLFISLDKNKTN